MICSELDVCKRHVHHLRSHSGQRWILPEPICSPSQSWAFLLRCLAGSSESTTSVHASGSKPGLPSQPGHRRHQLQQCIRLKNITQRVPWSLYILSKTCVLCAISLLEKQLAPIFLQDPGFTCCHVVICLVCCGLLPQTSKSNQINIQLYYKSKSLSNKLHCKMSDSFRNFFWDSQKQVYFNTFVVF